MLHTMQATTAEMQLSPFPAHPRYTFGFYHNAADCENHTALVNGWPDGSSGRVTIYHEGQFGTVCGRQAWYM